MSPPPIESFLNKAFPIILIKYIIRNIAIPSISINKNSYPKLNKLVIASVLYNIINFIIISTIEKNILTSSGIIIYFMSLIIIITIADINVNE